MLLHQGQKHYGEVIGGNFAWQSIIYRRSKPIKPVLAKRPGHVDPRRADAHDHDERPDSSGPGRGAVMPELPLVGDEFAGYRMRAVLGRGGMSVVYQAENLRLNNVIAVM